MARRRWMSPFIALLAGATALAGGALPAAAADPGSAGSGAASANGLPAAPSVRLMAPRNYMTVYRSKGQPIFLDPGVLVASVGGAWRVDAARADYDHPVTAAQVIQDTNGRALRPLPDGLVTDFSGLQHFLHVTVKTIGGALVTKHDMAFCPAGVDTRVSPNGPLNSDFPRACFTGPFTLGTVWGIERGWAVSAMGYSGVQFDGPNGKYWVTVTLGRAYASFFHVSPANASVRVEVNVKKGRKVCVDICPCQNVICPPNPLGNGGRGASGSRGGAPGLGGAPGSGGQGGAPGSGGQGASPWGNGPVRGPLGTAPTQDAPDPSTLPDLVALPAWGIAIDHENSHDYVDFSATVWNAGPAPLIVEGYRRGNKKVMNAWQYFFRDGKVAGRARVGTLMYDKRPGHEHWHFQQFAQYALLDASRNHVVVSTKDGFCLAPTDAIDMTVPGADWNPGSTGLATACGDASSVWTREALPAGWGDTYVQTLPGQSLDITNLPNNTYYIQIKANPTGLLYEGNTSNDTQLRQIELGGTPGHRTVTVEPWHGITV